MRLILVRHGESVGNFENRLQGQADYDLTDLGRSQAALTADRLHRLGTSAVYSSHLLRAHATAKAIATRLGVEHGVLEDVSEYHFGEMSGATYAEVRERFGAVANPAERVYPGEEGRDVFFKRVTEALWGVCRRAPGRDGGGRVARRADRAVLSGCARSAISPPDALLDQQLLAKRDRDRAATGRRTAPHKAHSSQRHLSPQQPRLNG